MTQHQDQQIKTKTCAMDSHTLPLSNENSSSIFKSLCTKEIKIFKIPRVKNFQISIDHFIKVLGKLHNSLSSRFMRGV